MVHSCLDFLPNQALDGVSLMEGGEAKASKHPEKWEEGDIDPVD